MQTKAVKSIRSSSISGMSGLAVLKCAVEKKNSDFKIQLMKTQFLKCHYVFSKIMV